MPAFLFTDIEASTRLWEEHPDAMGRALARHDTILREAVDGAGGSIVKTTGDGLMAVFPDAASAAAASVSAQLSMTAEPWDETGPLRVRMGIHAGDADERDGDYFGPVVNRTARIMAAGHGGQVLLSEVAAAVAAPLPEQVSVLDLGVHRLKDLTRPEHLFQVVHNGLPADFPALATLDARPHNLPIQDSEFFGRESELAAIVAMLDEPGTRLVTLTGPGGTGKTRLGLQVAAELSDHYGDGVFFVDLSPERDPDAAYEAITRVLDITAPGRPMDVLEAHLRDRHMLLVLDNFEQVTEAASGIADLLQRSVRLEVLVTSREPLRVRAEHVFPVPPLGVPDPAAPRAVIAEAESVRLFADRAQAAMPGFAIDDLNAGAIADICARLDGLPLAIELAAARLNVFTPADLLARLGRRTDALGSGGRDLPARQRTLRNTIEWSYELLDSDECRLFEILSVFTGARLEAIEAVAAGVGPATADPVDVLASLVDKSLIRSIDVSGSRRFSMLHTIREFAAERLATHPELESAARSAHAEHFSAFAQELRRKIEGPDRSAALDELASEIGNLRAAWRYWVDHADLERLYLLLDGLWALHDARGWYHASIELANDVLTVLTASEPSPEREAEEMVLRTSLARALLAVHGWTVEAEEAFRRALELSRTSARPAERFPTLRALATYYTNLADFARAAEIGKELLDLAEAEDDDTMRVEGHFVYGVGNAFSGDPETGLQHLDRAIELFDPAMHVSGRFRLGTSPGVVARTSAAILRWQGGEPEQAARLADDAVTMARRLEHPFSTAYCSYHVGFLHFARERFDEAERYATELSVVAAENEYPIWKALASVLGGVARSGSGRTDEGLAMTEAGFDLYSGLTTPPVFWPYILSLRAFACGAAGQTAEALALVEEAIAVAGGETAAPPDFLVARGDLIRSFPGADLGAAAASYEGAIRGAAGMRAKLFQLRAITALVDLRRSLGAEPDGSGDLAELYETFTEGFDEPDLVRARAVLADRR